MDVDHTDAFKGLYDNLMDKYNGENLEKQAYLTTNGHKTQKSGQKKETMLSPVLV